MLKIINKEVYEGAISGATRRFENQYKCIVFVERPILVETFDQALESSKNMFKSIFNPDGFDPNPFKVAGLL